jgi:hypothetical protein
MAEDKASAAYTQASDDTKTVKTLINEIIGASLACFSHCTAYQVVWDSEDSLVNTYKPKDAFRVYTGNNRLSAINRLLDYTKCVMRAEDDGKLHIFNPTTTGTTYDYEYALETGHPFFAKALRNRLTIPNYITVQSRETDTPQYIGIAQEAESYNKLPKREYHQTRLESADQAEDIAEALLAKAQMWCESGSGIVPLNVGAEVYDYIKVTDEREEDSRVGNIGKIVRHYNLTKNEWRMTFVFGNWQTVRKALADLGVTSDDIENYFSRLSVGDLYVEHILAKNMDFVWIDPDNTIDLSKIGDTLDNLPDGEVYARVKTLHLDAGLIKLDENILYKAGYDPSTKWTGSDLDDLPDGVVYRRAKSAALTAGGLVILDQVVVGTYGLVLTADISAGHIKLSSVEQSSGYQTVTSTQKTTWNAKPDTMDEIGEGSTYQRVKTTEIDTGRIKLTVANYYSGKFDGKWYLDGSSSAGVSIAAGVGINIWGRNQALTTRATETGAIQCYVGSDGAIYAGGGTVKLDSTGITITSASGSPKIYYYYGATYCGYLCGQASGGLTIHAQGANLTIENASGNIVLLPSSTYGVVMTNASYLDLPYRGSAPYALEGRMYYDYVIQQPRIYFQGAWRNITTFT